MRKRIILIAVISATVFFLAGVYMITSVETTVSELNRLIKLHQVEILRNHLLIRLSTVQGDLELVGTGRARPLDIIVSDVVKVGEEFDRCFSCHHEEKVLSNLVDLKNHFGRYKDGLSKLLTIRANAPRLRTETDAALKTGENLLAEVNTMINFTGERLTQRTQSVLNEIAKTKGILFVLIATGPLIVTISTLVFVRGVSNPLNALLNATRTLKGGDLDYRVEGLKDEFGEVAESFNEMANSLREQMLRVEESEKRYRMLFERAGDAIFLLDGDEKGGLRILSANEAAANMHGYTVDELLTMKMSDILSTDPANGSSSLIQRILNGEWVNAEVTHHKKDGTVFPVEMGAGLLDLGNQKYVLAFDRDVSERKTTEESLQRAEQLKVAGSLAAGLTHELKNYLAGIKVSAEVLLDELVLSEDHQTVLRNMVTEIRQMELLMKELLNFARPSVPQLVPVTVNAILDSAMAFSLKNVCGPSRAMNSVTIIKAFGTNLPRTMADPMKLQQAFMNLLLNAVDALTNGGTLSVKTSYDPADGLIRISIADTGSGIGKDILDKLFEPFFTTKPRGTGLGLPITKRLIEQHGGSISVRSSEVGTTFEISLPVREIEGAGEA
ncbi:MAG TPA: ATP-binding protein [Thermodesulfovibrionales bacterium]|nr:ATP-binding protein [Thermodesulfovibrionales bacterium]